VDNKPWAHGDEDQRVTQRQPGDLVLQRASTEQTCGLKNMLVSTAKPGWLLISDSSEV